MRAIFLPCSRSPFGSTFCYGCTFKRVSKASKRHSWRSVGSSRGVQRLRLRSVGGSFEGSFPKSEEITSAWPWRLEKKKTTPPKEACYKVVWGLIDMGISGSSFMYSEECRIQLFRIAVLAGGKIRLGSRRSASWTPDSLASFCRLPSYEIPRSDGKPDGWLLRGIWINKVCPGGSASVQEPLWRVHAPPALPGSTGQLNVRSEFRTTVWAPKPLSVRSDYRTINTCPLPAL